MVIPSESNREGTVRGLSLPSKMLGARRPSAALHVVYV